MKDTELLMRVLIEAIGSNKAAIRELEINSHELQVAIDEVKYLERKMTTGGGA